MKNDLRNSSEECIIPLYRTALDPRRSVFDRTHGGYWLLVHRGHDGFWFSWQKIDSKPRRGIGGKRNSLTAAIAAAEQLVGLLKDPVDERISRRSEQWVCDPFSSK